MDLKKILTEKGYNENRLAKEVGCSRQAINRIVHGSTPSISTAKKIGAILNLEWEDFYR